MNKIEISALSQFDELPASAHVRLRVVGALFGISTATVWRWSKSGQLPKPVRINGVTLWNVAALRAHMPPSSASASATPNASAVRSASDESKE